jgi:hypothetical protein
MDYHVYMLFVIKIILCFYFRKDYEVFSFTNGEPMGMVYLGKKKKTWETTYLMNRRAK